MEVAYHKVSPVLVVLGQDTFSEPKHRILLEVLQEGCDLLNCFLLVLQLFQICSPVFDELRKNIFLKMLRKLSLDVVLSCMVVPIVVLFLQERKRAPHEDHALAVVGEQDLVWVFA